MNVWEGRLAAIGGIVVLLGVYDAWRSSKSALDVEEAVAEQREGDEEVEEKRQNLRRLKLKYVLVSGRSCSSNCGAPSCALPALPKELVGLTPDAFRSTLWS